MSESKALTAKKITDTVYYLEEYNFLFHKQSLKVLGVLISHDNDYNLRQLTSTEQLIAESFGLKCIYE